MQRPAVNLDAVADRGRRAVEVHRLVYRVRADHAKGKAIIVLGGAVDQDKRLAVPRPIRRAQAANGRERLAARHVGQFGVGRPLPPMVGQERRRFRVHFLDVRLAARQGLKLETVPDDVRDEKVKPTEVVFGVLLHVAGSLPDNRKRSGDLRI